MQVINVRKQGSSSLRVYISSDTRIRSSELVINSILFPTLLRTIRRSLFGVKY